MAIPQNWVIYFLVFPNTNLLNVKLLQEHPVSVKLSVFRPEIQATRVVSLSGSEATEFPTYRVFL
jgi:hypothetical protein